MKNGKIGYAVVGLGIGKAYVDAAAAYDRCELIAVCDLIQEKMDKVVGRYPGTRSSPMFGAMNSAVLTERWIRISGPYAIASAHTAITS